MNLLFALLVQAPVQPTTPKYPESNITVERFMLPGRVPEIKDLSINDQSYF